jgi:hypothetical protein
MINAPSPSEYLRPLAFFDAKTATERQQQQRGEKEAQAEEGKNRHPGDGFTRKYPPAGGDERGGDQQHIRLTLPNHRQLSLRE